MLNVPVAEVILNKPGVRPLIRQGEAARVPQHVRVGGKGQPGPLSIIADRQPGRLAVHRPAPFAYEKGVRLGLHFRPLFQPCLDNFDLIGPKRVRRGESFFQPLHVQHPAFKVHLRQNEATGLRHAHAVPEHQKQQTAVPGLVPAPLGGGHEPVHFG